MDKETVLEIIRIIDKKIRDLKVWHDISSEAEDYNKIYKHQMIALEDLKDRIKDHRIIRDEDKEMGL